MQNLTLAALPDRPLSTDASDLKQLQRMIERTAPDSSTTPSVWYKARGGTIDRLLIETSDRYYPVTHDIQSPYPLSVWHPGRGRPKTADFVESALQDGYVPLDEAIEAADAGLQSWGA